MTYHQMMPHKKTVDTQNKLMELASAHIVSRAIHVAARMNVADYLVDGSCNINELASKVHANTDALYRLMRLLASNGIFSEDEKRNFSLTALAQPLLSNHPTSLKSWLSNHDGDEKRWRSYGHMEYSVQTGKPAFNHVFGQGYFDALAQDPEMAASFDEGMRTISDKENSQIVESYDFSHYKTIIDIGGGKGGLLAEIVKNNTSASGILFDLPHVLPSAQDYLSAQNLEKRITCVTGNFFDTIPDTCNMYILKRILHDWNDKDCIKILSTCRKSMKADATLLIIEAIVEAGNTRDFAKDVDIAMLVLFGGKERTKHEWEVLLQAASLRLVNIHKTPSMLSILEVVCEGKAEFDY